MRDQRARQILNGLVSGVDPFTEQELAAGTVLQHPDVMRAMLAGCSALDERTARAGRRALQPRNIGKAWTPEEQERLTQAFKSGENLEQVAARHGRTVRGIESRLEILGLITSSQRTTENRFGAGQNEKVPRTAGRKARAKSKKAGD